MREGSGQTIYLKDYQPPEFRIEHTDLYFLFERDLVKVTNRMKIRRTQDAKSKTLFLNGDGLTLKGLSLNGEPVSSEKFRESSEGLFIEDVPNSFDLEIKTELCPAKNTSLEGLFKSAEIFATQNEPEGFRKITYFLDRPDVLSTYTTTIEADRKSLPVLLSNGNRVSVEEKANGKQVVKWHDPFPKPSYLFCLIAGELEKITDKFTTMSGRQVLLEIYAEPGRVHLCHHAMQALKSSMKWDEERFGREYDLDLYMIVAIDDFNGGAMENKGLNVFNSRLILADEATATDTDFENIEAVIAHEYFHNWTGNRVTLRDWFQLSLKEGLTVYRDQEFTSDLTSRAVKRIEDVKLLRNRQFAEDAGPSAHPVRPESAMSVENFFTTTIYEKGAELIRMIEQLVGRDGFRKGMDLYFERHDGHAVTTDDFVQSMEDANSIDLNQFRNWYRYAGTPRVHIHTEYNPQAKTYTIDFEQSCPDTPGQTDKPPFHIPIAMALLDSKGQILKGCEKYQLMELKEKKERLVIEEVMERPYLSALRAFSAPVLLNTNSQKQDLVFLASHDSDAFNRWEALQKLFIEEYRSLHQAHLAGKPLEVSQELLGVYANYFETAAEIEPAYLANLLSLPHPYFIAQNLGQLDPEALEASRLAISSQLVQSFKTKMLDIYQGLEGHIPSGKEFALVAKRQLKNQLLRLMCVDLELQDLAVTQYSKAKSMTDQMAALNSLCFQPEAPKRDDLLAQFYEQWKMDSLVLNKWFGLQALVPNPKQWERVAELTRHPAFDLKNPNKAYSLIGFFASENHTAFHQSDGKAYDFFFKMVLELDRINPSVAARLSQALQVKPLLKRHQQELLNQKIEAIINSEKLSKNTLEILQKMAK